VAVADMTADEAAELGTLVKEVSRAVQEVADCDKTYVVQFAGHQDHPHVHVHVIPRARDLQHEHQGARVVSLLGVPEDAAVPDERMNEIAQRLDGQLQIWPRTATRRMGQLGGDDCETALGIDPEPRPKITSSTADSRRRL